jgi:hypothetical protein
MTMTDVGEGIELRIVGLLLIVAAMSVFGLWTLSTATVAGESTFAVYLSLDLLAFAMISYVYRVDKRGDDIAMVPMLAGLVMLLILAVAGLAVY